jgi:hypothetical protein
MMQSASRAAQLLGRAGLFRAAQRAYAAEAAAVASDAGYVSQVRWQRHLQAVLEQGRELITNQSWFCR